ncbi:MAG: hypothetical protein LW835_13220 [Burkholderiaceae bacterium]|nr:hypothetical protein [Burkholderiales bacterium]MCE2646145.1 hypothetical protein [Burkholderiaceae bacterium]
MIGDAPDEAKLGAFTALLDDGIMTRAAGATSFLQVRCPVFRVLIGTQRSEAAISARRPSGACGRAAAIG